MIMKVCFFPPFQIWEKGERSGSRDLSGVGFRRSSGHELSRTSNAGPFHDILSKFFVLC
jgi:hypothetical protein